jgi:ubiquinone/menaquinone biosynthesis C-methylase UbiE
MTASYPPSTVQEDFDRIALLPSTGWDHSSHYHGFLLKHIPAHCTAALEIGCGTGEFARLLAQRSERVLALDFSPKMIQVAREKTAAFRNIDFQLADAVTYDLHEETFDCIASIATFHHLPMGEMFLKIRRALKVGGVLTILDLYQSRGLGDFLSSVISVPYHLALKLIKTGGLRGSEEARDAWARHTPNDHFLTLREIRKICAASLPGAHVRRHLMWRYSVIWKKVPG